MKTIDVVIGANYGDEGKGHMVNYLAGQAARSKTLAVVRFNGGAQAGHTVQLADGTRHVFSHYGSGAFYGADTVLSRFFVANPTLLYKEYKELRDIDLGHRPVNLNVRMSALCPVTTVAEVMINRMLEVQRGSGRHGSVGVGFGETLEREHQGVHYRAGDNVSMVVDSVVDWYKDRCEQLDLHGISQLPQFKDITTDTMARRIKADHQYLTAFTTIIPEDGVYGDYDHVIFEGAQGLLLDMDRGEFPHVTRSNTGIKNVRTILEEHPLVFPLGTTVNVVYVSRTYMTRHGAGTLAGEEDVPSWVVDDTNKPNDWQGSLRYAPLDVHELIRRVVRDYYTFDMLQYHHSDIIALTCCDQYFSEHDEIELVRQFGHMFQSHGPTDRDIQYEFYS